MTMIEKVTKAIESCDHWDGSLWQGIGFEELARAALAAMRDLPEPLAELASEEFACPVERASRGWRVVINEAISN